MSEKDVAWAKVLLYSLIKGHFRFRFHGFRFWLMLHFGNTEQKRKYGFWGISSMNGLLMMFSESKNCVWFQEEVKSLWNCFQSALFEYSSVFVNCLKTCNFIANKISEIHEKQLSNFRIDNKFTIHHHVKSQNVTDIKVKKKKEKKWKIPHPSCVLSIDIN